MGPCSTDSAVRFPLVVSLSWKDDSCYRETSLVCCCVFTDIMSMQGTKDWNCSLLMSSIVVGYTLDYRPYQRSYSLVKEYIPLTVVWEISILLSYQTYPRHLFVSTQTTLQSMPCSINQTYGGGGHFHLTGQSTEPQRIPKKVCVLNTCLWVCTFLCLEYLLNLFASPKFRCCRLLA